MSRRKWLCLDCRVDTGRIGEHYMLVDSVWAQAHNSKTGMLCVGCVEARIGRRLCAADFNDSYLNRDLNVSMRLLERMRS